MKNKETKIISIISLIALALTLVTATFAYFMAQTGKGKSTDIKINASTVDTFTFETGSVISLNINQDNLNEVKSSTNNERFILFLHYGVATLCAKMGDKPHFDT